MKAASVTRTEFAPPPTKGLASSFALAVLAHAVLLVVLRMGVEWKHDLPPNVTVEAELWSEIPQQAAPKPLVSPMPEEQVPPPLPELPPLPQQPVAPTPPQPAPKPLPNPAIAIAKEKAKQEKLAKEREAKEAAHEAELKAANKRKAEQKEKRDQEAAALDNLIKQKTQAANDREKVARDKKQLTDADAAANAKLAKEVREKDIARMMAGNGDAGSTGTTKQASGPSPTYAGRIRARIKPNITYTETISGNPVAEVLVHIAPDGTILNRRLTKSSGVKSWDAAVLNAIDKTEVLPTDVDGRAQLEMTISFRPKD